LKENVLLPAGYGLLLVLKTFLRKIKIKAPTRLGGCLYQKDFNL